MVLGRRAVGIVKIKAYRAGLRVSTASCIEVLTILNGS